MGADQAQNRAAIHLRGGFVPWISDGGLFGWFKPAPPLVSEAVGESFLYNVVLTPRPRDIITNAGTLYYVTGKINLAQLERPSSLAVR